MLRSHCQAWEGRGASQRARRRGGEAGNPGALQGAQQPGHRDTGWNRRQDDGQWRQRRAEQMQLLAQRKRQRWQVVGALGMGAVQRSAGEERYESAGRGAGLACRATAAGSEVKGPSSAPASRHGQQWAASAALLLQLQLRLQLRGAGVDQSRCAGRLRAAAGAGEGEYRA
jgi:hypothetical protein